VGNTLGVAINPAGLQNRLAVSWKWRLYDSKSPWLSESHVTVGVADTLSPAYNRVEGWIGVAPLSVLEVRAGVEPVVYFGTFAHLLGFPSYDADFSDDVREARKDQAEGALGLRWHVTPILQFKAGHVLAWSRTELEWWRVDAPGEVFYEPTRGVLLDSDGDRSIATSSLLLYEFPRAGGRKVLAGVTHELVDVPEAPRNRRQRLGPVGMWVLGSSRFGVKDPTVYASVLYNVEDPVREGKVSGVLAVVFGLGR
jgi:hypothetical protein